MSEVIKKALTDKQSRNAGALKAVATSQQVLTPWGGKAADEL